MSLVICTATVPSERFMYSPVSKSFVTEASSLGAFQVSQIYDDASDVGFIMVSKRTGREAVFYLNQAHHDREGDLTHWTFKPTPETLAKYPQLREHIVIIFND